MIRPRLLPSLLLFQALLVTLLMLAAPCQAAQLPPDMARIRQRGRLLVAMYHKDVPPFMFHDSQGRLQGHEVDLARGMARALGVEVEFDRSPRSFDAIIDLVASGRVDLGISLISRTLKRARKVRFSTPYIILKPVLLVNRLGRLNEAIDQADPLPVLASFSGRAGEKAGTSYAYTVGRLMPEVRILTFKDWDGAIKALVRGEVDAVLRDEIGVQNALSKDPSLGISLRLIPIEAPGFQDALAVALPPESAHLQEWVNLYIDMNGVLKDGEALLRQYSNSGRH